MHLVFLGNGPFARPILEALACSRHELAAVVARPDRPRGKHQRIEPGPIARLARDLCLPLVQPADVNSSEGIAQIGQRAPDLLVVADFGQILSPQCLAVAPHGGINVHASLLPKYRGAAPVPWAIHHGETETGVTIIRMSPRLDAGAILLQERCPIDPDVTAGELEAELSIRGAALAVAAVHLIETGQAPAYPQPAAGVSRAPRLRKEDGHIQWDRSARAVHDHVRAMLPWPVAFTLWHAGQQPSRRLQILRTVPLPDAPPTSHGPGTVVAVEPQRLLLQAGSGWLAVHHLRLEGRKEQDVASFCRGHRVAVGDRFL